MSRLSWPLIVMVCLAAANPLASADAPAPPTMSPAAEAVSASIEVERTLQREDVARHERLSNERDQAVARLSTLYDALDVAVKKETGNAQAIDDLLSRIELAERERAGLIESERAVVDRIRDRGRRIELFEERLQALQSRASESTGPLTARWDVVLLPGNQRGTFVLSQNGTLVTGTYSLEGGWSGSLQGTLVNRKVYLERIDSKLGRSAKFEGYLSSDGSQIRGTWLSYELAAEVGGAGGQWSAVRRPLGP